MNQPLELRGSHVVLTPSVEDHAAGLAEAADEETFRYFVTGRPTTIDEEGLRAYLRLVLGMTGVSPFTVFVGDRPAGMSCYLDIRPEHHALEIGMTWYGRAFRGTVVNPECKLLLLGHAFEVLNCRRVQLKTDGRNVVSQRAIEKLGAKREGVLRRHMTMPDGFQRDTVMYSILDDEWPEVRRGLQARIASFQRPMGSN